jgi:hypothetical protein
MVALVSYFWNGWRRSGAPHSPGWRRPGAPHSHSLFSISSSRYSSPCCREADGGASFRLLERVQVEEARSATFFLAIQYLYHSQGIVLLAAVKLMVALVSYSGSGRRRPGAPSSPSLFSISYARYSSPCCRQADGGASFLLWEWAEEARSAIFSLATSKSSSRYSPPC